MPTVAEAEFQRLKHAEEKLKDLTFLCINRVEKAIFLFVFTLYIHKRYL